MLAELLVYDDLDPKPAALNMAVDEALLISATAPINGRSGPSLAATNSAGLLSVEPTRNRRRSARMSPKTRVVILNAPNP